MNKTSLLNRLNTDCKINQLLLNIYLNHKPSISDFLECSKHFKKEKIHIKYHSDYKAV